MCGYSDYFTIYGKYFHYQLDSNIGNKVKFKVLYIHFYPDG